MPSFLRSQAPKSFKRPNCGFGDTQAKKLCYACGKTFNKRLGRAKAAPVEDEPFWHACAACVMKLMSEQAMKSADE
jgi:hypothetical protein